MICMTAKDYNGRGECIGEVRELNEKVWMRSENRKRAVEKENKMFVWIKSKPKFMALTKRFIVHGLFSSFNLPCDGIQAPIFTIFFSLWNINNFILCLFVSLHFVILFLQCFIIWWARAKSYNIFFLEWHRFSTRLGKISDSIREILFAFIFT